MIIINIMNKTVLITGVTGTIGRATALEIAKSGACKIGPDKRNAFFTEIHYRIDG